jgi:hypothetical protein
MPPPDVIARGVLGRTVSVAESRATGATAEVVCPHCKKTFEPEPLEGSSAHHRGFKCPHCRLFVPSDRAGEPTVDAASRNGHQFG